MPRLATLTTQMGLRKRCVHGLIEGAGRRMQRLQGCTARLYHRTAVIWCGEERNDQEGGQW